jgi:hypothetical protein
LEFFIDAAEVLHLERLLLAEALVDDPQPVPRLAAAAPAPELQRRQIVPRSELRHEKAVIENSAGG